MHFPEIVEKLDNHLSKHLSIYLSIYLSVCLSIYLSIFLSAIDHSFIQKSILPNSICVDYFRIDVILSTSYLNHKQ